MISRTANNKRSSPATYASDTMQTVQRKKKIPSFQRLYMDSASIPIFTFLYTKSRRYATKLAYPAGQ